MSDPEISMPGKAPGYRRNAASDVGGTPGTPKRGTKSSLDPALPHNGAAAICYIQVVKEAEDYAYHRLRN